MSDITQQNRTEKFPFYFQYFLEPLLSVDLRGTSFAALLDNINLVDLNISRLSQVRLYAFADANGVRKRVKPDLAEPADVEVNKIDVVQKSSEGRPSEIDREERLEKVLKVKRELFSPILLGDI